MYKNFGPIDKTTFAIVFSLALDIKGLNQYKNLSVLKLNTSLLSLLSKFITGTWVVSYMQNIWKSLPTMLCRPFPLFNHLIALCILRIILSIGLTLQYFTSRDLGFIKSIISMDLFAVIYAQCSQY